MPMKGAFDTSGKTIARVYAKNSDAICMILRKAMVLSIAFLI